MEFGDERIPERVWDKLHPEPNTGCWLWSGAFTAAGYGNTLRYSRAHEGCRHTPVHRWLLEVETGTVGVQARHQCRQRPCANPDHLLWGSNSDNQLDSVRDGTHVWARKTQCPSGHPYDDANTYRTRGKRLCLTCKREGDKLRARVYRKRKKEEA